VIAGHSLTVFVTSSGALTIAEQIGQYVIEILLPPTVQIRESFCDQPVSLFPVERARIFRAVRLRQAEFATARGCARRALASLGIPATPIVSGAVGEPIWPTGIVGSITHCEGYRAAAVARDRDLAGLGIDAEPSGLLPEGVLHSIASPLERDRLKSLAGVTGSAGKLLFSAKEAIYKAWYPLTNRFLDFHEVDVAISPRGTFEATVAPDPPFVSSNCPTAFTGHWLDTCELILTAVSVPSYSVNSFQTT